MGRGQGALQDDAGAGAEVTEDSLEGWVAFGTIDDIPKGGGRPVRTLIGEIGIFRTEDDRVFALDNMCPHKGVRLSSGAIEGDCIVCPSHGLRFSLATGRGAEWGTGMAPPVPIKVVDRKVLLRLDPPPW